MRWQTLLVLVLAITPFVATAEENAGLSVTVSSNRETAYSNEQILVTVRVEVDSNAFSLTGDALTVENATVLSLSKNSLKGKRDGHQTAITERVYAVFGNNTGALEIPALKFQAQMPVAAAANGNKSNPTLRASSQVIPISIVPPPLSSNTWFPATSVALQGNWGDGETAVPELVAGEPVDIYLSIKVTGQHPAAIAPLQISTSGNLRSYPAAPDWEAYQSKLGFGGVLTQRITLVASDNNDAFIHQLTVPWWDINARRWRVAMLDRQALVVRGEASGWKMGDKEFLVAVLILLLPLAVLSAAVRLTVSRTRPVSERSAWRAMKRAMHRKDRLGAREALLAWCRLVWPGVRILGADSVSVHDNRVARIFRELDEGIYSDVGAVESGELDWRRMFAELVQRRREIKQSDRSVADQACLYPTSKTH